MSAGKIDGGAGARLLKGKWAMPGSGAMILSDLESDVLRVVCTACPRSGRYSVRHDRPAGGARFKLPTTDGAAPPGRAPNDG
jgi:hypothetical protein